MANTREIVQEILKVQQKTNECLTAIEHRMEALSTCDEIVKMLRLLNTLTERIETKLDILNSKIFEQEADIQLLKRVN